MQTYVVRFNDRRISEHLSSGTTIRKVKGQEVVEGTFKNRAMPNTSTTIAVRKELPSNRPLINISQETLDKIVPYFNLIDLVKDERIETAKVDFGIDAFWNHPELFLPIDNKGIELTIDDDPTKNPIDFFWLSVMRADPDFFVDDGTQRRPETMSEVKFIVQPKYKAKTTIKTEYTSLVDSRDTMRAIFGMSRDRKMFIIDQLGENLYDPIKSEDRELEDLILENLDKNRERRIENGMKFGDFVEAISKQTDDQFSISQVVKYAFSKGLIEKSGDMYYYNNMSCGNSAKEVEEYFMKPENNKSMIALELKVKQLKKIK